MATPSVPTTLPFQRRSFRDEFLGVYDQEHARTMKILRAYPREKVELRPHPKSRSARELA
jgi:hypothetical protein